MKTLNVLTRVLFAMAAVVTLTHCGSSGSNNTNANAINSGYYISGANCINQQGQIVGTAATCPVSNGACGTSAYGTSAYGTTAYGSTYPGVASNCGIGTTGYGTTGYGTTGYGTTGYGQQCYGNYIYQSPNGGYQPIVCQGQCHGVTMLTYPGYQQVYCQ